MCRNRMKLLLYLCGYLFIHVTVSATNNTESVEEVTLNDYYNLVSNSNNKTMWNDFLTGCKKPSVSCIQNYIYKYLNDTLESKNDLQLDFVTFSKNNHNYTKENNAIDDDDDEVEDVVGRSSIGADLKEKASKFLVTHNIKFQLPDYVLDGALVEISPRSIVETGAEFNVNIKPKQMENVGEGRILFKKIRKFFSNKLMTAFLGILVVIKLVKLVLMFLAPAVMGAAAAKQLLVKILLFVFPAVSYFFKLCPYYKHTKYHHHQHHIKHIHHIPPHLHHQIETDHSLPSHHPTHFDTHDDNEHHYHGIHDDGIGYYSDGVSAFDSIGHRKSDSKINGIEDADVNWKYGQGQLNRIKGKQPLTSGPNGVMYPNVDNLLLKAEKEAILKARLQEEQKRIQAENKLLQDQLKKALKLQEKLKFHTQLMTGGNSRIPPNLMNNLGPVSILAPPPPNQIPSPSTPQLNIQIPPTLTNIHIQPPSPYLQTPNVQSKQSILTNQLQEQIKQHILQSEQEYQKQNMQVQKQQLLQQQKQQQQQQQQPQQIQQKHSVQSSGNNLHTQAITSTISGATDPFYSPILEKIDKILIGIGFNDEGCRERLVCSMYKNPEKFSPHSNLVSAELSRDSSELQKPTNNNVDVVRFYKYVQAARDGQDNRDCNRLYPMCSVNTEL